MAVLLDVNVLVALAWPNHLHHELATSWFTENHKKGWATSPGTETGFVRVSANRQAIPAAKAPGEAIDLLRRLTELQGHNFWTDDIAFSRSELVDPNKLFGHRQVTDAHLVALAIRNEGRLATFDRGVPDVVPDPFSPEQVITVLA